jgi:hypothetical protein
VLGDEAELRRHQRVVGIERQRVVDRGARRQRAEQARQVVLDAIAQRAQLAGAALAAVEPEIGERAIDLAGGGGGAEHGGQAGGQLVGRAGGDRGVVDAGGVGAAGAGRGGVDLHRAGGPGQRPEHERQEVGPKRRAAVAGQGSPSTPSAASTPRSPPNSGASQRGPRRAADRQPGERAPALARGHHRTPITAGHELRHRHERHQAEVGQLGALAQPEVDRVSRRG